jgi:two-component system sensor histidine kinase UhpB
LAAGAPPPTRLYLPLDVRRTWWTYPAVPYGAALLLLGGAVGYVRRSRWLRRQQLLTLRRRLAHDLHDELGSLLVRASLQAQRLRETPSLQEPAATHLIQELQSASQAMRDIVWSIDTHSNTLGSLLDRMREHVA